MVKRADRSERLIAQPGTKRSCQNRKTLREQERLSQAEAASRLAYPPSRSAEDCTQGRSVKVLKYHNELLKADFVETN
jgi:hypothetical protein